MNMSKYERILEIFFRALRGEYISAIKLADEYGVSTKSIQRSISELRNFLANHRELVGNTELEYLRKDNSYRLKMEDFLTNKELFALLKVMIGTRALSSEDLLSVVNKLKKLTTPDDRQKLEKLIQKEMFLYAEIHHDCESVPDNLWRIVQCISEDKEISIDYYRMDRQWVTHRIRPKTIMFVDHYFYLIAYFSSGRTQIPYYFRIDRIKDITIHRHHENTQVVVPDVNEADLRNRSLFMWPGKLKNIRFEFSGPSLQSLKDKLPTAKVVAKLEGNKYLVEAEVYGGEGIKMWLLSQGSWVKVVAPDDFVEEMKAKIEEMRRLYC